MKAPVILLFSNDPAVCKAVEEVAMHQRHGLRVIRSTQDAFRKLKEGFEDADLAMIDLDPGLHGSALLEAISDRVPVIVITSLEEEYMKPIASRHGAVACLAKPFSVEQLGALIEELLNPGAADAALSRYDRGTIAR